MITLAIIGGIVCGIIFGKKRSRRRRSTRTVRTVTETTTVTIRPSGTAPSVARKLQAEKDRAARLELNRSQAVADLGHIEQMRRDILKCYASAEAEYNSAQTDRKKETALRRMVGYDAKLRQLDKQRERAAMIAAA